MDGMSDMSFVVASPERIAMSNPFGEAECVSVDLRKDINVTQLADEIGRLTGFPVMVMEIPFEGLVSKLHVSPIVDEETIMRAIEDHEIDDLYGMDDRQRERGELMRKLSSEEEMSVEEIRRALMIALASS